MASKTREILIDVARQLFALKGVAHTTMNDIASASAKGRRTIYMYFKNKKEIYNAVLEEESDSMVGALTKVYEKDMPVKEKLTEFLRLRLERYLVPSTSASARAWLKFDSRRLEKVQAMAREKEKNMFGGILDAGIEQGVFSAARCRLLRSFLNMALTFEDTQLPDEGDIADRRRSIESFIEFIVSDITLNDN